MISKGPNYEMVSIDKLELDVKNPRIALWMEMYKDGISEAGMKLALMRGGPDDTTGGTSFLGLKQSIKTNGGVFQAIIVNHKDADKLVVIEGNTRVMIYKEFAEIERKEAKPSGRWDKIPAVVYQNMSEEQIDAIRLQAHLVGARPWDPYSKAKYLDTLSNKLKLPYSQIVDFCGGNQREVETLIAAYNDMEDHYRPLLESDQNFDYTRFSGFVELQNPRVQQAIINANFTKKDFAKWINEKKLYPLSNVRQLPRILQNKNSRDIFLKNDAEEAIKYLISIGSESSPNLKDSSLINLATEIYNRVNGMRYGDLQRLREDTDSDEKDTIRAAKDALVSLWKDINSEDE
jgi:hypothetical protein